MTLITLAKRSKRFIRVPRALALKPLDSHRFDLIKRMPANFCVPTVKTWSSQIYIKWSYIIMCMNMHRTEHIISLKSPSKKF